MYDLEILLPITANSKYFKRLQDFKRYGLRDIEDYKIKLKLLPGTETNPEFLTGWDSRIDVEIVPTHSDQVAAKVNSYYAEHGPKIAETARWFMRLDDDSITNISLLMEELNNLDHNDIHYLITRVVEGDTSVEKRLLTEMGYKALVAKPLLHELECCVLSQACFRRIMSHEDCQRLFQKRGKVNEGFTDICIAQAAKINKILMTDVPFLCADPHVQEFVNQKVAHIHYIAHDVHTVAFMIMVHYFENDATYAFLDRPFLFGHRNQSEVTWSTSIRLKSNGLIDRPHYNEMFWDYNSEKKELKFLSINADVTDTFHVESEDFRKLEGKFSGADLFSFLVEMPYL